MTDRDPHADGPVETGGAPLSEADAAVLLLHGRGARAAGMLDLAADMDRSGIAYVAPQAAKNTWYPRSFLEPIEDNEPWLSSALGRVGTMLDRIDEEGPAPERTVLVGFSQGGCLAAEYVARNPRRYGGLAALSGGLIGPEGTDFDYEGSVDGTPVFLGCSDRDPHIPLERVHETAAAFEDLDGDVTERIYEGMGHTINEDELDHVRSLLDSAADRE